VDVTYEVKGNDLPQSAQMFLFWADGASYPASNQNLAATTPIPVDPSLGSHTVHVSAASFQPPDPSQGYLLAVADPQQTLASRFSVQETDNFKAVPVLTVAPTVKVEANPSPALMGEPYAVGVSITNNAPYPLRFRLSWDESNLAIPDPKNAPSAGKDIELGPIGARQTTPYSLGDNFNHTWLWLTTGQNPLGTDDYSSEIAKGFFSTLKNNAKKIANDIQAGGRELVGFANDILTLLNLVDAAVSPERTNSVQYSVTATYAPGNASTTGTTTVTIQVPDWKQDYYALYLGNSFIGSKFLGEGLLAALTAETGIGAAIAAGLLETSLSYFRLARSEWNQAKDPPDSNYTEIVSPSPLQLPSLPLPPNSALQNLLQDVAMMVSLDDAAAASRDRGQGAAAAGDYVWEARQLSAAAGFSQQEAVLATQIAQLNSVVQASESGMVAAEASRGLSLLQSQGFPESVLTLLTGDGWSAAQIENLRQVLIQLGPQGLTDSEVETAGSELCSAVFSSVATSDLQAAVQVGVQRLGQPIQALAASDQQGLDSQQAAIQAHLAQQVVSPGLPAEIQSFLGDARGLLLQTNNVDALQPYLQFGYSALVSLQTLPAAPVPTTTVVTDSSGQNSSTYGANLTFTATVTSTNQTLTAPIGSIEFSDGSTDLGAGTLTASSGSSSTWAITLSSLHAGAHAIEAVYTPATLQNAQGTTVESFSGSDNSNGLLLQTINPAPLIVSADNKTKVYGEANLTLTASYAGFVNADTAAVLSGNPALATSAGQYSLPGDYLITLGAGTLADPDYEFQLINGTLTVNEASTGTALSVSATTPLAGVDLVTLSGTVTIGAPGSGALTGSVDFYDTTTGTDLGSVALVNGVASLNAGPFSVGGHAITATYSGDGNFLPSGGSASLTAQVPASLSGSVFADFNDDGQLDFGENGISGVSIHLTGTDDLGHAVDRTFQTDGDGAYLFLNLRAGSYSLTKTTQPAGYTAGTDSVGTAGGNCSPTVADQFFVQLAQGVNGLNYNYGERPAATGSVQKGQTAGIGFWNNKNGQALILALNGGGTSHQLGDWLAATFAKLYGANSANDLAGKGNAYIAALFQQDFLQKGQKLDAQVLATALSVYATNATLDSTQAAAKYGFKVSGDGVGTATFNVGSNGDAFGVANNTTMTVLDLLLAADAQAVDGVLYNGNTTRRNEANNVFSALNQAGGIS
jgi:hypothetical protein